MSKQILNVWITGASSGIGMALAHQYLKAGHHVIISGRKTDVLQAFIDDNDFSDRARVEGLDLSIDNDYPEIAARVASLFGGIDVLINNAGVSQRSEAVNTSLDVDRNIMEINFFGNIALTKAVVPHLLNSDNPSIIVISSLAGKFGFFLRSAYAASKHALHGFYDSLRLELHKDGVQVLIACPSFVRTSMSQNALREDGKPTGEIDPRLNEGMSPEECAAQIIHAARKGKKEVVIGAKGKFAVWLSKRMPNIFFRILLKQSAK